MSPGPADQVSWLFRAGADLHQKGDFERAQIAFERLLTLAPHHTAAAHSLGFIAMQKGELEKALVWYDRAAADGLDSAELYNNRGVALRHFGREASAAENFRKAVDRSPGFAQAWGNLGACLMAFGDVQPALSALRKGLDLDPSLVPARSVLIFAQNYLPEVSAAELRADADAFDTALSRGLSTPQAYRNAPDPARAMKVGLVSGDFRNHAVARFLMAALAADRKAIEFHAYSTGRRNDAVTERLKGMIPAWTDASHLSDEDLARQVAADEIDILVDLSGYTEGGRLPLFARKPAPIAVTWLGYSGTTGLKAIDYVLADPVVLPPTEEPFFSEKPWRLPDSYLCYTPAADVPEVAPLPAMANGYVTFGSFNNLNKVSDRTVALWVEVLRAVPHSRLALKGSALSNAQTRSRLAAQFAAAGVDPDRLVLLDYEQDERAHLAAYGKLDIALDPFPYNGTTTTCEALLMGVPVVGLRGNRFIAHVGESILQTAELGGWVAADREAYVEIAQRAAADLDALESLRSRLRMQFLSSPMCDAPRFARHFEDALRGMWHIWCAAQRRS